VLAIVAGRLQLALPLTEEEGAMISTQTISTRLVVLRLALLMVPGLFYASGASALDHRAPDHAAAAQSEEALVRQAPGGHQAPVGHRQPRATDIPSSASQGDADQVRLQHEFDRKLQICRNC
jgi:hypothetical protein